MKERVREAIFNLLGPAIKGKHAIDLFAGTGALGLEALSRGAVRATFIERHFPTARVIRDNIQALQYDHPTTVREGDAFFFAREMDFDRQEPWVVFCSPPYEFYVSRQDDMIRLIEQAALVAPPDSLFVAESDQRFDMSGLPRSELWDQRTYPPAMVAIAKLPWTERLSEEDEATVDSNRADRS